MFKGDALGLVPTPGREETSYRLACFSRKSNVAMKANEMPIIGEVGDGFHIFAMEWESQAIRFYVDGMLFATKTAGDVPAGRRWVFDHPFFVILNLAVGGNLPGDPNASTVFPQQMLVDYVRVYSRAQGPKS